MSIVPIFSRCLIIRGIIVPSNLLIGQLQLLHLLPQFLLIHISHHLRLCV